MQVPGERIELSCLAAMGLESIASANSATPALPRRNFSAGGLVFTLPFPRCNFIVLKYW